jgi:hypothetical protein
LFLEPLIPLLLVLVVLLAQLEKAVWVEIQSLAQSHPQVVDKVDQVLLVT